MVTKSLSVHLLVFLSLFTTVFHQTGCNHNKSFKTDPHRVDSHAEAGSVHVSPVSVQHWYKYKKQMQPKFTSIKNADEALVNVIQTTSSIEEKFLDALELTLKVSTPTISQTVTRTETEVIAEGTGKEPTSTFDKTITKTKEKKPGDLGSATIADSIIGKGEKARKAAQLPPASGETYLKSDNLGQDPMMKYWAATALYQEVQMLNRYIEDAAIGDGYDPYVVRLQVTLMPSARREPYDAYVTFSFFEGGTLSRVGNKKNEQETDSSGDSIPSGGYKALDTLKGPQGDNGEEGNKPTEGETNPEDGSNSVNNSTSNVENCNKSEDKTGGEGVVVLPLLVTDNLEAMLHSRSIDRLQKFALGLAAMYYGVGANVDLQKYSENMQTLLGQDLNSLLTVARVSENTLRVRLGAMQQGGIQYAMVPRTHNITLLVLLPKKTAEPGKERTVRVVSQSTMIDATEGDVLRSRTQKEVEGMYLEILEENDILYSSWPYSEKNNLWLKFLGNLQGRAQQNNWNGYISDFCSPDFEALDAVSRDKLKRYKEQLWLQLVSMQVGSRYATFRFQVPGADEPSPEFPKDQNFLAQDDRINTKVILRGGKDLQYADMSATLRACSSRPQCYDLVAENIHFVDKRKELSLSFPSLVAWEIVEDKPRAKPQRMELTLDGTKEDGTSIRGTGFYMSELYIKIRKPEQKKPSPGFTMTVSSTIISYDEGNGDDASTGMVQLYFKKSEKDPADKINLGVTGANIVNITLPGDKGTPQQAKELFEWDINKNNIVIKQDGTINLYLSGLSAQVKVGLIVQNDKGLALPGKHELTAIPSKR